MNIPKPNDFDRFYAAIYGYAPFPWQSRLAARVCAGEWPDAIALPTAAGKTTCIDIAVFALACRAPTAARRIFFVVDRRIVVDQAFRHAKSLAGRLAHPMDDIVKAVADSLAQMSDDRSDANPRPLDVYALRGGMYRETAWTRSPLQPTIVTSTVDQVGSRLLFRGYGVSDSMKPIHAGLVGNDSLILLDEAHCARPFDQTMRAVKAYRNWNTPNSPFAVVSITATPTIEGEVMRADSADFQHQVLGRRIAAKKPTKLVAGSQTSTRKAEDELLALLEAHAKELSKESECVGIIVNRVKTARRLKAKLGEDAVLLTGRMRPLDRDRIFESKLQPLLSNGEGAAPRFVIGTQCLECGADFDFHALVTECASLDALRQRFGRLNRVARRDSAKAVIVMRGDQIAPKEPDPIYGESLTNTWKWLSERSTEGIVDFGVAAMDEAAAGEDLISLNAPTDDAPVLFPAHLDCWVQTHPIPTPDPDPALFLHGPTKPGQPDVQVVFRSDLGTDATLWAEIVALCPPSSSEAVAVPIGTFKKWIADELAEDNTSDIQRGDPVDKDSTEPGAGGRTALRWRGPDDSEPILDLQDVSPNDVYVVPISPKPAGADESPELKALRLLADLPEMIEDFAEEAFQKSRDRALLRLRDLPFDPEEGEFEDAVSAAIESFKKADSPEWIAVAVNALKTPRFRDVDPHPLGGCVVTGKTRLGQFDPEFLDDNASSLSRRAVTLKEHSLGVAETAARFAAGCKLDVETFQTAGLYHDIGKLDPRFQAMLKQASPQTAFGEPWAKSAKSPRSAKECEEFRRTHKYPKGGRHELLSTAMLETITSDDLLLHLISTHHGCARPFAGAVQENVGSDINPFAHHFLDTVFSLESSRQQIATWNAKLPERFWSVVRSFGWWGTAYREAVFRLADHTQSRREQQSKMTSIEVVSVPQALSLSSNPSLHNLPLIGLDGSNPLGFLAALGTLVFCDEQSSVGDHPNWLKSRPTLVWGDGKSPYVPVLCFQKNAPSPDEFIDFLVARLPRTIQTHPSHWVVEMLEQGAGPTAVRDFRRIRSKVVPQRQGDRFKYDWISALSCESAIDADSQLQTVRCDYLIGNLKSLMHRTTAEHLRRCLFAVWDYADGLANQSLHWEPTEDRRHAYQWHMPSGDPTRTKSGGMLGANRLGLEAWPLFPSFPDADRVVTRGFCGNRANNTYWTWPLWKFPASVPTVASLLAIAKIQRDVDKIDAVELSQLGVSAVFRLQRILVGKTPNFTTAVALT